MKVKLLSVELYERARRDFNKLMLDYSRVVRLIGYSEDDTDCYVILKDVLRDEKPYYMSCVGYPMSLEPLASQGQTTGFSGEQWNDYIRIDKHMSLNGAPPQEKFLLDLKYSAYCPYSDSDEYYQTAIVKEEECLVLK